MKKILFVAFVLLAAADVLADNFKVYKSEECPAAKAEYKQNCIAQKCQNKEGREKGKCEYDCQNEAVSNVRCLFFDTKEM